MSTPAVLDQANIRWSDQRAEHFLKKYPRQYKMIESAPISKKRGGITAYDIVALGEQLDTVDLMIKIHEANGSVGDLGPLPKLALDVIAAYFGITPLTQVAGIQPIDEPLGLVYFKDVVAKTTRGNVTAEDILASPLAMPGRFPENYATDTLVESTFYNHATNGAQTGSNVDIGGGDTFTTPVDPERCVISGSAIFNSGSDEMTLTPIIVDPNDGVTGLFSQAQKINGTTYYLRGSVVFSTGKVEWEWSADPSGATTLKATFGVLLEAGTDVPSQQLKIQAKPVQARFFALKSTYGFAEDYMLNKRWGMSAEGEMTKDLTAGINNEVFNLVLAKILPMIPDSAKITWGRQPGNGVSLYEHIMTLPAAITDAEALMTANLGRGSISTLIGGLKACAVIRNHPDFVKQFDDNSLGPHVYGTFQGMPVVRVPSAQMMSVDKLVGVWKGNNPFECPVVWAPYMPLALTPVQGTGANPLQRQRAACIWGAIDTMIPNGLCEITLDQSNFDYGSGLPSA